MARRDELFVGVDVGTTQIVAIVAEMGPSGLDIIGLGAAPSYGIKNGVVINIDRTVEGIRKAVEEAELMAARTVGSIVISLSGSQIRGFNSRGLVAVRSREVRDDDVRRVIEAAQAIRIPQDRQVIHTLPQGYVIDNNDVMSRPIGMAGVRMEAKVHIVTCSRTAADNLVTCCNRNDLTVEGMIFGGVASSEAVLADDEKELGVVLADIGGGTTDLIIWHQNAVIHTASLPFAGELITNDVAMGLRTPRREAEKIKSRYGCAICSQVSEEDEIEVPGTGGREPVLHKRSVLAEIIEPRVEEIMYLIYEEIQKSGFADLLGAGLVLTGGTAELDGLDELAEQILNIPVRIGTPRLDRFGGLVDVVKGPAYSTVLGLASWHYERAGNDFRPLETVKKRRLGGFTNWLKNAF
jgi:cell division protein FtsA